MRRGHRVAERADHVERRRRGIRERPQDVEHRAHAERLAHGRDVLHRGVIVRREQEREAAARETRAGRGLVERDRQAERREHVGAAALARDGAVAVLDDGQPARGREQRRCPSTGSSCASRRRPCRRCRRRGPARSPAGARARASRARSRGSRRPSRPSRAARRAARPRAPGRARRAAMHAQQLARGRLVEVSPRSRRSSSCCALRRSWVQEVLEQLRPFGRQHALGVELHAFDVRAADAARP